MEPVRWTRMSDGSAAEHQRLMEQYEANAARTLVPNLVGLLGQLKGPKLGYQIDRYEHSLQSASRAMRDDQPIDLVVGALLHDVGDCFAPANHSEAAAAVLAPYIDDRTHWIVKHHGLFQGYYYFHHVGGDRNARDRYRSSPHFEACVDFCRRYDQNCFDPDYKNLPIKDFMPLLDEVFSRRPRTETIANHGPGSEVQTPSSNTEFKH